MYDKFGVEKIWVGEMGERRWDLVRRRPVYMCSGSANAKPDFVPNGMMLFDSVETIT